MNILFLANAGTWYSGVFEQCLQAMGKQFIRVYTVEEALASIYTGNPLPDVVVAYSRDLAIYEVVDRVHDADSLLPIFVFTEKSQPLHSFPSWVKRFEINDQTLAAETNFPVVVADMELAYKKSFRHE